MSDLELDEEKIDKATLALLWLNAFKDSKRDPHCKTWKKHDFATMDRLHEKDLIFDPVGKAKSVMFTPEGEKLARELCVELFGKE